MSGLKHRLTNPAGGNASGVRIPHPASLLWIQALWDASVCQTLVVDGSSHMRVSAGRPKGTPDNHYTARSYRLTKRIELYLTSLVPIKFLRNYREMLTARKDWHLGLLLESRQGCPLLVPGSIPGGPQLIKNL